MNIAILLRYMNQNQGGHWDHVYHMQHDYELMARKYGVGLCAIITEFDAERICDVCDGLILPGSGNPINPAYYGEAPWQTPYPVDEYCFDSKIIDIFIKAGKPIFGICAGLQELNIFFGGSIKKVNINYSHGLPKVDEKRIHSINIKKDSFVHDVFGKERADVNSHHGWGIDRLAEGFEVVATADDGVIEAIENKERLIFATQWHPEQSFHVGDEIEHKFFENFIACCKK